MTFEKFIKTVATGWEKYISQTQQALLNRHIVVRDANLLFPVLILFIETKDHFIAEVFGAERKPRKLVHKFMKTELNSTEYLYQSRINEATSKPQVLLGGTNQPVRGACFNRRPEDVQEFEKRFPFVNKWYPMFRCSADSGPVLGFAETFQSAYLTNCLFLNRCDSIYRAKFVSHMVIALKQLSKQELSEGLSRELTLHGSTPDPQFVGIQICGSDNLERLALSGQFSNMFLVPTIRETTITAFLEANPSVLNYLFNTDTVLYQPRLEWVEGNPSENEKFIIPDVLIKRRDGLYDICDFKTVAEKRDRITKGHHKRRRFIDYVQEGIAQLSNYEEYFTFSKNAVHALDKYEVSVSNPVLYLIVGSCENVSQEEIKEASRMLRNNIRVIDYDTLNTLLLASGVGPTGQA